MRRIIFILLSILLTNLNNFSQEAEFTASAPKVISVGEQFRLTFSLNKKASGFRAPDLRNFNILGGPSTSSSSNIQIINGKMIQSFSYTYTYILQATKKGKFTIDPAQVIVNRKQYKSNSLTIEVIEGTSPDASKQSVPSSRENQAVPDISNKDLFVRVLTNKRNVYQDEHIVATIKIYSKLNIAGFENVKFPPFNGFWTQEIETPNQISLQRENVNGVIYNSGIIKKTLLFPQRSGEIVIDPFELECVVRQRMTNSRSIFDDFFGTFNNVKKYVKSEPVKIIVKPLPSAKPSSFNGAVGSYSMKASVDKQIAKTNDAITLKVNISGNGNIKLIDPLKIDFPPDFETYDPKISHNVKNSENGSVGNKTFEYLMIPRHSGNYRIPPIEFSYFDTKLKKYKTLTSGEFKISVEKGKEIETGNVVSGFSKEDVKFIGSDIQFIKINDFKLKRKNEILFGSLRFYLSYLIVFFIFLIIFIIRRKQIKQNENIQLVKNRKANKFAKKRLKLALQYLKENNRDQFYEEVLKAMWGYLSDKLNIPVSDLSKDTAFKSLENFEIEKALTEKFLGLIDICEYARFAPSERPSQMDSIYSEAIRIISKLRQKLK